MNRKYGNKKKTNIARKLKLEFRAIDRPTRQEQFHGTWTTFVIAVVAAASVSAVDSVCTALVGLFV